MYSILYAVFLLFYITSTQAVYNFTESKLYNERKVHKNVKRVEPKVNIKQISLINHIVSAFTLDDIEDELCINHLMKYREAIGQLQPWALKMLDSSAKFPFGVIVGTNGELGQFNACLDVHTPSEYGPIKGQMCTFNLVPGPKVVQAILEMGSVSNDTIEQQIKDKNFNVYWPVCLPDSCPVSDIEKQFNQILKEVTEGLDLTMSLNENSCTSYKRMKPVTNAQWTVITVLGVYLIFLLVCTLYDIVYTAYYPDNVNQVLLSFSLYANVKMVFSTSNTNELDCLNGIRTLCIIWVIIGHRFFVANRGVSNVLDLTKWLTTVPGVMVDVGGPLSVDSFFMLSGLLLAYTFFCSMRKGTKFSLPMFYLHRYLRITPTLAVVVVIAATCSELMGSGPLWNSSIPIVQETCAQYWWACLLHIQYYTNQYNLCIFQSWFLTCDWQYYLLSPVVLFPLWKRPRTGRVLLLTLLFIAISIRFTVAWQNNFKSLILDKNLRVQKYFAEYYIAPHQRVTPFLVGIAVGHLLYLSKDKPFKVNTTLTCFGWTAYLAGLFGVLFGGPSFRNAAGPEYESLMSAMFLAVSPTVWTAALGWLVYNCISGRAGILNAVLSFNIFKIISKLNYTMYLVNLYFLDILTYSAKSTYDFSYGTMLYMIFGDFAFTIIFSFLLTVCVELPFRQILKAFRKTGKTKTN